jgi:16S rRNA (cytosine967-C5)-methyltransferase
LREEDEEQVERFLAAHADFALLPIGDIWPEAVGGDCPTREPMLRLSPARHGTDGFFVAAMARALAPKAWAREDVAAVPDDEAS